MGNVHNGSPLHIGIDIGSTTTKAVAIEPETGAVAFSRYRRHNACQAQSVRALFEELLAAFPQRPARVAVCGSGGEGIAKAIGAPFVQEVVANSLAVRELHGSARTAIELGGQDAKVVFFRPDGETGQLAVSDMRMNGSCAGGTGAFVDEIASLLHVPVEKLDSLARQGKAAYDISGRCGVFAKTDIQPLLNQGAAKEDIARSSLHSIAKQVIGGLSQGLEIKAPVVFEGGPLTFNPTLVDVFAERLGLAPDEVVRPDHPETIVAHGAALSLTSLFAGSAALDMRQAAGALAAYNGPQGQTTPAAKPFFASAAERAAFEQRHRMPDLPRAAVSDAGTEMPLPEPPRTLRVHLGIDSGSTTTKLALLDDDEHLVDQFYAPNNGEPLEVASVALAAMRDAYRARGTELEVASVGTTGYGELLFASAFSADSHVVETVAHAQAAAHFVPDASFVLDIGGQDMKAIWLEDGIVTDITVNEACSSGCGSFLENLASSLGIPVGDIAEAAFSSRCPADLGSRCTVFMNSRIVTEQRNGKSAQDIVAGLCRSIVENVFTKVIRVPNLDALGSSVVVQGGTMKNDAVLCALEQYLGRTVTRAPYPGIMGAIGAALVAKRRMEQDPHPSSFVGLDSLDSFSYERQSNVPCPFCANRCSRTLVTFGNGATWVSGNRCPRGEVIGDPHDEAVRESARASAKHRSQVPNLFDEREQLLFKDYPCTPVAEPRDICIGIPRVLAFWDTMPFWSTLFRTLGFHVKLSPPSSRKQYERGIARVMSDTVCFPAKLVHGHIEDLAAAGVDRIFMPIITCMPSENTAATSESMCAIVKGYPMVVRSSDNPEQRWGVPFDHPLFHWHSVQDRNRQLGSYLAGTFGIPQEQTAAALQQADAAYALFRTTLVERGRAVIEQASNLGGFAVVLASRPYQNDPLVNHGLPSLFTDQGIPVLTVDAVPGACDVSLEGSRIEIVNNFHARMLSTALVAAGNPALEYVQIVSFGCGHDAILADEVARLMRESSGKVPLMLKLDESDIAGPLRIRVNSFVETVRTRRASRLGPGVAEAADAARPAAMAAGALPDPYPVKFTAADRERRVILVPNVSRGFCKLMSAAMGRQSGVRTAPLPLGGEEAIKLGKRYVHNDACFPAQMMIGEALQALMSGRYQQDKVAIGMGKLIGDCRLTHYAALLRKALDEAGFPDVAIITNDDKDLRNLHPGYRMGIATQVRIAMFLPMLDVMEEVLRKVRPYELADGQADAVFEAGIDAMARALEDEGLRGLTRTFRQALGTLEHVPHDRSHPRPRVLVVGEYLLNFHPGTNHHIERYLEEHGLEVVEPRMADVYRKTYFYQRAQVREFHVHKPAAERSWLAIADNLFEIAQNVTDRAAASCSLYEPVCRMPELVGGSDPIIHHSFDTGEGFLIPAEMVHHAAHGVRACIILQPFGCLPNHICGRGIVKQVKERYPDLQVLPLDYEPDASFANIENRLQMLIMNLRSEGEAGATAGSGTPGSEAG